MNRTHKTCCCCLIATCQRKTFCCFYHLLICTWKFPAWNSVKHEKAVLSSFSVYDGCVWKQVLNYYLRKKSFFLAIFSTTGSIWTLAPLYLFNCNSIHFIISFLYLMYLVMCHYCWSPGCSYNEPTS